MWLRQQFSKTGRGMCVQDVYRIRGLISQGIACRAVDRCVHACCIDLELDNQQVVKGFLEIHGLK